MKNTAAVTPSSGVAKKRSQSIRKSSASSINTKAAPRTKKVALTADQDLQQMIRTEAYFRSERRGFAAGAELQDWIEAEQEIRCMLDLKKSADVTA